MSPIAKALTEREMRDVSAYYASMSYQATKRNDTFADTGLLQTGATLSAIGLPNRGVQACVNCHGPHGTGLPPYYPYLAGQHASYIEQQLKAWRSGERKAETLRSKIMADIALRMNDDDIRAVALYYSRLEMKPTRAPSQRSADRNMRSE